MGILLALGRQSDMFLIKTLSVGFIEFIRGVPLITLLFTASLLLQYFLPPNTNFDLILRGIILVTFFAAAYIAEVIRGGLAALPRGQYEAANALGLDYWSAQRLIIMPQALKIAKDEHLFIPLHQQPMAWAMRSSVADTVQASDNKPRLWLTQMK
jgi:general L-amino acid transport system permease protein